MLLVGLTARKVNILGGKNGDEQGEEIKGEDSSSLFPNTIEPV
jgi:hypothetical protein